MSENYTYELFNGSLSSNCNDLIFAINSREQIYEYELKKKSAFELINLVKMYLNLTRIQINKLNVKTQYKSQINFDKLKLLQCFKFTHLLKSELTRRQGKYEVTEMEAAIIKFFSTELETELGLLCSSFNLSLDIITDAILDDIKTDLLKSEKSIYSVLNEIKINSLRCSESNHLKLFRKRLQSFLKRIFNGLYEECSNRIRMIDQILLVLPTDNGRLQQLVQVAAAVRNKLNVAQVVARQLQFEKKCQQKQPIEEMLSVESVNLGFQMENSVTVYFSALGDSEEGLYDFPPFSDDEDEQETKVDSMVNCIDSDTAPDESVEEKEGLQLEKATIQQKSTAVESDYQINNNAVICQSSMVVNSSADSLAVLDRDTNNNADSREEDETTSTYSDTDINDSDNRKHKNKKRCADVFVTASLYNETATEELYSAFDYGPLPSVELVTHIMTPSEFVKVSRNDKSRSSSSFDIKSSLPGTGSSTNCRSYCKLGRFSVIDAGGDYMEMSTQQSRQKSKLNSTLDKTEGEQNTSTTNTSLPFSCFSNIAVATLTCTDKDYHQEQQQQQQQHKQHRNNQTASLQNPRVDDVNFDENRNINYSGVFLHNLDLSIALCEIYLDREFDSCHQVKPDEKGTTSNQCHKTVNTNTSATEKSQKLSTRIPFQNKQIQYDKHISLVIDMAKELFEISRCQFQELTQQTRQMNIDEENELSNKKMLEYLYTRIENGRLVIHNLAGVIETYYNIGHHTEWKLQLESLQLSLSNLLKQLKQLRQQDKDSNYDCQKGANRPKFKQQTSHHQGIVNNSIDGYVSRQRLPDSLLMKIDFHNYEHHLHNFQHHNRLQQQQNSRQKVGKNCQIYCNSRLTDNGDQDIDGDTDDVSDTSSKTACIMGILLSQSRLQQTVLCLNQYPCYQVLLRLLVTIGIVKKMQNDKLRYKQSNFNSNIVTLDGLTDDLSVLKRATAVCAVNVMDLHVLQTRMEPNIVDLSGTMYEQLNELQQCWKAVDDECQRLLRCTRLMLSTMKIVRSAYLHMVSLMAVIFAVVMNNCRSESWQNPNTWNCHTKQLDVLQKYKSCLSFWLTEVEKLSNEALRIKRVTGQRFRYYMDIYQSLVVNLEMLQSLTNQLLQGSRFKSDKVNDIETLSSIMNYLADLQDRNNTRTGNQCYNTVDLDIFDPYIKGTRWSQKQLDQQQQTPHQDVTKSYSTRLQKVKFIGDIVEVNTETRKTKITTTVKKKDVKFDEENLMALSNCEYKERSNNLINAVVELDPGGTTTNTLSIDPDGAVEQTMEKTEGEIDKDIFNCDTTIKTNADDHDEDAGTDDKQKCQMDNWKHQGEIVLQNDHLSHVGATDATSQFLLSLITSPLDDDWMCHIKTADYQSVTVNDNYVEEVNIAVEAKYTDIIKTENKNRYQRQYDIDIVVTNISCCLMAYVENRLIDVAVRVEADTLYCNLLIGDMANDVVILLSDEVIRVFYRTCLDDVLLSFSKRRFLISAMDKNSNVTTDVCNCESLQSVGKVRELVAKFNGSKVTKNLIKPIFPVTNDAQDLLLLHNIDDIFDSVSSEKVDDQQIVSSYLVGMITPVDILVPHDWLLNCVTCFRVLAPKSSTTSTLTNLVANKRQSTLLIAYTRILLPSAYHYSNQPIEEMIVTDCDEVLSCSSTVTTAHTTNNNISTELPTEFIWEASHSVINNTEGSEYEDEEEDENELITSVMLVTHKQVEDSCTIDNSMFAVATLLSNGSHINVSTANIIEHQISIYFDTASCSIHVMPKFKESYLINERNLVKLSLTIIQRFLVPPENVGQLITIDPIIAEATIEQNIYNVKEKYGIVQVNISIGKLITGNSSRLSLITVTETLSYSSSNNSSNINNCTTLCNVSPVTLFVMLLLLVMIIVTPQTDVTYWPEYFINQVLSKLLPKLIKHGVPV